MTEKDKQDWSELYEYVRKEIMNYDCNQKLSKTIVLRLKGLTEGKHLANKNIKSTANYSYEIVLYTFKIYRQSIIDACLTKNFKDDTAKFMYISAIIDNKINDVYNRIMSARQSAKKINDVDAERLNHKGVEFKEVNIEKETQENKVNDRLKDLW